MEHSAEMVQKSATDGRNTLTMMYSMWEEIRDKMQKVVDMTREELGRMVGETREEIHKVVREVGGTFMARDEWANSRMADGYGILVGLCIMQLL